MSDSESDAEEVQFNLKVMINKQKTKVLFAEVDSDFADVLLSFLTLPLGKIVGLLKKHYGDNDNNIGSLTSLYNGVSTLDSANFWTKDCKKMLLNPRSSFEYECRRLKIDLVNYTQPATYFICESWPCPYCSDHLINVSMHYGVGRCICGRRLKEKICLDDYSDDEGGVFTVKDASFVISDDLKMVPNGAGSVLETLKILGITDMDGAELRNVTFGYNEIIDLLRGSLLSRATLSDVVLRKRQMALATRHGILLHEMEKEAIASNSKKMVVKVMVQKSTNKLLFAQSEKDFVDFLFSFLTIPLGGVERLLKGKTCLKNIDNLYRSLGNIDVDEDKYLNRLDAKSRLMNPEQGYMSPSLVFPLSEETPRRLYCNFDTRTGKKWLSYSGRLSTIFPKLSDKETPRPVDFPKSDGSYVKEGLIMYMVTDDLSVIPLSMTSNFSVLSRLKIPFSDVEEVEMHIGLQEGLNILKASLTSTCALTEGLKINSMLRTQPISKKPRTLN